MNKLVALISFLLMATVAMGQSDVPQPKVNLRQGSMQQTVFPGDTIEHVVYVVKGAHVVEFSLLDSLTGKFWYDDWLGDSLVTISGTVASATDPGEYTIQILAKDTVNETSLASRFNITVLSKDEAFVHSDGSLKQSVMAGDSIEPIVFDYQKLRDVRVDNLPSDLIVQNDTASKTIIIDGAVENVQRDKKYTFSLVAYLTERDSVIYNFELDVEHIPVVTMVKVLENDSQAVVAGDSIKPITLKYENITDLHFKDIPRTLDVFNDPDKKTILLRGTIPEDFGDSMLVMSICAKGLDNNDTAFVKMNIKHKPGASSSSVAESSSSSKAKSSSSSKAKSSSSGKKESIPYVQNAKVAQWSLESNVLNVAVSEPVSVQIIDMMGNLLNGFQVNGSASIDLGRMQRGAYLVRFVGGSLVEASRITVK